MRTAHVWQMRVSLVKQLRFPANITDMILRPNILLVLEISKHSHAGAYNSLERKDGISQGSKPSMQPWWKNAIDGSGQHGPQR